MMKRLLSTLGLVALLHCEPAEEEVTPVSTQTVAAQQESEYPVRLDVTGELIVSSISTPDECGQAIMYLVSGTTRGAPHYAAFCFPYGYMKPQYGLLEANSGNTFHVEGIRIDNKEGKPVLVEHTTGRNDDLGKLPLYNIRTIEVKKEFPSHIELSPSHLRRKISDSSSYSFCPDDLSRYFVAFEDTLVTVCADREPNEGLAHRIDYRKDEIGQPTYRVE